MQSASFRIWTRVAVPISYDGNHYTTDTSLSLSLSLISCVGVEFRCTEEQIKDVLKKHFTLTYTCEGMDEH